MTFLPIVERELRTRARRGFTYWLRVYIGGLGIFICLVQFFFTSALPSGGFTVGAYTFNALLIAAFMLCCGACLMTATTISMERTEGTLPLLFLTQVKSNDVLVGKLLPTLLAGLCAVGAFLPVLMIPVLSGGVTGGETFRSGVALAHALFLSLVLGLRASVRATSWFASVRGAIFLVLGWLFLPFVAGGVSMIFRLPWEILSIASPLRVLLLASESRYALAPSDFWIGIVVLQAVAWLLVLNTSRRLRKSLSEPVIENQEVVAPLATPPPVVTEAPTGEPTVPVVNIATPPVIMASPSPRPRPIGDGDPLQWLVRRQRGIRSLIWFGALVSLFNGLFFHTLYYFGTFGMASFFVWPANLAFDVLECSLFAWAITRFFVQARQTGELELIGTTPQGARLLVTAQRLAIKELFRGPIIVMMVPIGLRLLSWLLTQRWGPDPIWRWLMAGHTLWTGVNLYLGVTALIWVGTWAGLSAPNQVRAVISTVWAITVLPTMMSWTIRLGSRFFRSGADPDLFLFFLPGLTLTVMFLWLIHRSKLKLAGELRDAEMSSGSLFGGISGWPGQTAAAIRKARHWTPGERE